MDRRASNSPLALFLEKLHYSDGSLTLRSTGDRHEVDDVVLVEAVHRIFLLPLPIWVAEGKGSPDYSPSGILIRFPSDRKN